MAFVNKCKVNICDKPARASGLCAMHYQRKIRHEDPLYVNPKKTYGSEIDRFNSKVKKTDSCHIWIASKNNDGYGQFGSESSSLAHRFIYFYHNPDANRDLCVMHTCDNPSCVNIEHLSLGTHQENMNDRDRKGRCKKGEESGACKLSKGDVLAIRNDQRTTREIAKIYNVSHSHVSLIKRRKSWRHLNEAS